MKQEIYVKEMPKSPSDCPCNYDTYCNIFADGRNCLDEIRENCPLKLLHYHDKELVAKQINTIDGIFCHFINKLKGTKFDERMVFIELQALHQKIITTLQKEIQHDKN